MMSVNAFATLLEAFFNILCGHTHTHTQRHEGTTLNLLHVRRVKIKSLTVTTHVVVNLLGDSYEEDPKNNSTHTTTLPSP